MLVGTPRPVNLSVLVALGPALWIRKPTLSATHASQERLYLSRLPQ